MGRVVLYNGMDFVMLIGVLVYFIGDGKVIVVCKYFYAGNYFVIEYNSVYKMCYLYLDKILVKKG